MPNVNNTLYPPIIATYMPAFLKTAGCRIYFSISNYNTIDDIDQDHVQVSLRHQNTNASAFVNDGQNPVVNGIKSYKMIQEGNQYYITIPDADVADHFQSNQYYKVQIRFTKKNLANIDYNNYTWLMDNVANFSEWSTICLIRGIATPQLQLNNLQEQTDTAQGNMALTQSTLSVVGHMVFDDPTEKEILKSYNMKLYNSNDELLAQSGDIYSNTYNGVNELNYTFDYMLEDGASYKLIVNCLTRNLYSFSKVYKFNLIQNTLQKLNVTLSAISDFNDNNNFYQLPNNYNHENGCIQVQMSALDFNNYTGYITFRRASSRTNFTVWEDVHTVMMNDTPLNYIWNDYSIESGIWYKYCVQKTNPNGDRGITVIAPNPVMVIFEDMFLNAENKQLRIKFNQQINSYRKNVLESKVDTLGSQYPFIRRNGVMEYRQFSLSGMITLHTDYCDTFISKKDLYGSSKIEHLYDNYNNTKDINDYNDYIQEREFREKVIDFLYKDNVKLLRTTTEGNILVRLMDINLTPETALGRMIYSFSATAYEIDDFNIKNLFKYNICAKLNKVNLLPDENISANQISKLGQIHLSLGKDRINSINVFDYLNKKYKKLHQDNAVFKIATLKNVRFTFNSKPYLIYKENGKLVPQSSQNLATPFILGYLIEINNNNIYISSDGIYELGDTQINSISIPSASAPIDVTIDYLAILEKEEAAMYTTKNYTFNSRVGQLIETFNYNSSIVNSIQMKYFKDYSDFAQKVVAINGLSFEATPGTVFEVKDSDTKENKRIVLTENGNLTLFDDSTVITECKVKGIHLYLATAARTGEGYSYPFQYYTEETVDASTSAVDQIKDPIPNGVYTIQQKQYIYYNNNWYIFNSNHDVECPVTVLVDYLCDTLREER